MNRIIIFIGLKLKEIIKALLLIAGIIALLVLLAYLLSISQILRIIFFSCVGLTVLGVVGFAISVEGPKWISSNWRKAGEIEKKWGKK